MKLRSFLGIEMNEKEGSRSVQGPLHRQDMTMFHLVSILGVHLGQKLGYLSRDFDPASWVPLRSFTIRILEIGAAQSWGPLGGKLWGFASNSQQSKIVRHVFMVLAIADPPNVTASSHISRKIPQQSDFMDQMPW